MARIYKLSLSGLKLLYKVRHHKGHGIHSPFVYNLIHNVIEEKKPYYAYEDIRMFLSENFPKHIVRKDKYNRLLFRLINCFDVESILEIGAGTGERTLYLTAPSRKIKCICYESDIQKRRIAEDLYEKWGHFRNIEVVRDIYTECQGKFDCIFIDLNHFSEINDDFFAFIENFYEEKTFLVIRGIRNRKRHKLIWSKISATKKRTVKLDLFDVGIIFFRKDLYRWSYQISF